MLLLPDDWRVSQCGCFGCFRLLSESLHVLLLENPCLCSACKQNTELTNSGLCPLLPIYVPTTGPFFGIYVAPDVAAAGKGAERDAPSPRTISVGDRVTVTKLRRSSRSFGQTLVLFIGAVVVFFFARFAHQHQETLIAWQETLVAWNTIAAAK